MQIRKLGLLVFLMLSFVTVSFCQVATEEEEEADNYLRIKPHHSVTLELGMPVSFRNEHFKGIMQGIINFSPYYHFTSKSHFSVGAGFNYNYFWINHVVAPDPKNLGGIHAIGGFFKLGHEKFHTDRVGTDFGLKVGRSLLLFDSDVNHENGGSVPKQLTYYVEPSFGIVLSADEFTSFRWVLGYAIQKYRFTPTLLGFANSSNYTFKTGQNFFSRLQNYTQYLTVGFGFSYYIRQR